MPDFIRLNHTRYSWTSSRTIVEGIPVDGIVAIDFEETRERKIVYSNRQDGTPVGWTSGKYAVKSFKMKMLKEYAAVFKEAIAILGAGSIGDAEWTLGLQCVEPVIGAIPITLVATPCTIVGRRDSREEGVDELLEEFDLAVLQLIEGGTPLWSLVRSLQL
jgi:hypothetical protein